MKTRQLFLLLLAAALFSCATADRGGGVSSSAGNSGDLSLDQGIAQIARGLADGLPAGTRVAVVNLESPSARFSDYVLQELQGVLIDNHRLVVVERANLELLRNEVQFQMSGEVDAETAVNIGKMLGAQIIVAGNFADLNGRYRFRFTAIDVETAVRKVSPDATVGRDGVVVSLLTDAYFNTGYAHYEAKRYTEAVADFTRALNVNKDDEASFRYQAYSHFYLKDYDRTITDMSRLIQMNPGNAEDYIFRSIAYERKGEYDRAITDCNHAIQLDPNNTLAYSSRGGIYSQKGEQDRAIADLNHAIRLVPSNAGFYSLRGAAYSRKGEYDKAIADCSHAIQLTPDNALMYFIRGGVYVFKREYSKARADWEKTLQLDPTNANVPELLKFLYVNGY